MNPKNIKTKIIFLLAIFCAILMLPKISLAATTYYVSPSGNDSNSGSVSAPFKTIQNAANVVNPGDTVIVRDGTYTDSDSDDKLLYINRAGTANAWITFKAEHKWGAVLDGQSAETGYGVVFGASAQYIRIEDFEIKGSQSGGTWSNSLAQNIYIYRNHIHNNGNDCDTFGGNGVFQGTGAGYHTYDSNIIHDNGHPLSCRESGYIMNHGLYFGGHHTYIINNIFYNHPSGWHACIARTNGTNDGDTFQFINNTFIGHGPDTQNAMIFWADSSSVDFINLLIQNNIVYDVGNVSFIYFYNLHGSSTTYIKNNLTYNTPNLVYSYPYTATYTETGNIIGQDPLFIDVANRNFHLKSDSPAINAGLTYSGKTVDADGNPIVGTPDIGAYEYVGTKVGDTTPPSIPTALAATPISSSQINLSWTASTDNVGVAGYKVYRDGSLLSTVNSPQLTYQDTDLSPSTTYTYTVSAYDAAGNNSAQSSPASATTDAASVVYLSDLSWLSATNGYGPVEKDKSNGEQAAGDGKTITLNGIIYAKGLGVHAASDVQYSLAGKYSTFMADIGVDDEVGNYGSVIFQVFADGVKLYDSGIMTVSSQTKQVNVDVTGKNTLQLVVTDAGNGINSDHADWANARLVVAPLPDTISPAAPAGLQVQ